MKAAQGTITHKAHEVITTPTTTAAAAAGAGAGAGVVAAAAGVAADCRCIPGGLVSSQSKKTLQDTR